MSDLELALEKHRYRLNDKDLINVTAISGLLDDGKSGAFAGAAVKLTKAGENYREIWKKSGEDGSRRHGYCESFLRGEAIDCLPEDMGYVDAIEKFIVDYAPIVIELEAVVLSALGYGGRLDMIVRIGDSTWLIDLKTGKEHAVEHTLQLSAYRYADGIAIYDENGQESGLRPIPRINKAGCLYVREDGTYSLTEYPADETAFAQFRALLNVHQWTRTDTIKAVVRESRKKAA